jgi:hypothetical protein
VPKSTITEEATYTFTLSAYQADHLLAVLGRTKPKDVHEADALVGMLRGLNGFRHKLKEEQIDRAWSY